MLRLFIVISFLSAATGALADPVPLVSDALKETVSGSLVEIDTPLGTKLPLRFGNDGLVSAEAGELAPILGSAKDRGRWWVDSDKLCTKWFRWFDAQVRCITIRQDGNRFYWRKIDDGETGTATLVERAPPKEQLAASVAPAAVAKVDPPPARPAPAKEKKPVERAPAVKQVSKPEPASQPQAKPTVVARVDEAPENGGTDLPMAMMRVGGNDVRDVASSVSPAPAPTPKVDAAKPVGTMSGPLRQLKVATIATAGRAATVDKKEAVVTHTHVVPAAPQAAKRPPAEKRTPAKPENVRQVKPAAGAKAKIAAAQPSAQPAVLYKVRGVQQGDVLNVRGGPSNQHGPIASIPPTGRRVAITGRCQADWCPIQYGDVRGWVNRTYLAEEGSFQNSSSEVYAAKP